ncbi:hypothetical protein [Streptomyces sp. NPDC001315]|uniref:hypothetical protein n=1 Tax=Streptomyces sp. NPDC001315 TaxID=3364562 RepID=UPI0036807249
MRYAIAVREETLRAIRAVLAACGLTVAEDPHPYSFDMLYVLGAPQQTWVVDLWVWRTSGRLRTARSPADR